ncbi:MAG: hypothetical protein WAM89_13090 [Terriglobales bacterium]
MNWSIRDKNAFAKWSVMFVLLGTSLAWANSGPKTSAPARSSAPSRPASAPKAAPAQRPGGNANARPGGANANNRGPGGVNSNNRGPGGANANNRGPGGAGANNRGPGGANGANARGGTNNVNHAGTNNTNSRGGTNANTHAGANNNAHNGANNTGNRAGANNANAHGGANNASKGGHQPAGSKTVALKNGGSATFRKNGQVRSVSAHGVTVNHGLKGNNHIVSTHNGRTVVSNGRYGGYSQRAYYNHGGRSYVQRTYYRDGHYYAYGYRSYYYGGYPYYGYAPAVYWGPAYYGWAYNPWASPVPYGWGWGGAPWFGFYGAYFTPYPVYAGAAFWLADYLIAANLQAAYAAQQAAGDGGGDGEIHPPLLGPESDGEIASLYTSDPMMAANLEVAYGAYMLGGGAAVATAMPADVKQAIADEMKNEIAAEKAAATAGQNASGGDQVPAALDPKIRYFVVSSEEDLTTPDGTECALTAGTVIYRTGDTPDDDHMVNATVKSSKKDECPVGATVAVSVDDLQEMHNQLRIQMDAGLKELADKQGKNGLPAAPDTKTQAGEVPAPTPDTGVSSDLQQQQKDAAQVEAEAKQQQ